MKGNEKKVIMGTQSNRNIVNEEDIKEKENDQENEAKRRGDREIGQMRCERAVKLRK